VTSSIGNFVPIGGFFELEIAPGRGAFHTGAAALSSGRAALRCILEALRPSRAWLPFYICDAALQACAAAGVAVEFYAIDEAFDPVLPAGAPPAGECLVYVNYFGLKTSTAASLVAAHGSRVIVDDTQAFFATGYAGAWSFNSARKFFGVPDGGYAYGEGLSEIGYPRPSVVRYEHLVNRLLGHQQLAYEQYRESEALVSATIQRMSVLSERLLAGVDYPAVRDRRRSNFAALHEAFGPRNRLAPRILPGAGAGAGDVPYCYPLLSSEPVSWSTLWSRGVFAPRLWPEVRERPNAGLFARESSLADCLLPLPIDHRYGPVDVGRLSAVVGEVLGW
jgi:hypothetical protein